MGDSETSTEDIWTVQRILHWTTDYLGQKQIESPRLEAELLLAHARNCARIRLYTDFETALTDDERVRMRELVKRRAQREPLAYITGRKEFYGRNFAVGKGILVPRPETETLVDVCLNRIDRNVPQRICEVGFGSGCVSITLAKQRPLCTIWASDISETAMSFATQNVTAHAVSQQVRLLNGDAFAPILKESSERFEGIVSNPPYLRTDELAGLAAEVRDYESHKALVSGIDGLDLVRTLIVESVSLLKPGGWMALEVDPLQCRLVQQLFEEAGFTNIRIHKDQSRNDRVVEATAGTPSAST